MKVYTIARVGYNVDPSSAGTAQTDPFECEGAFCRHSLITNCTATNAHVYCRLVTLQSSSLYQDAFASLA